MSAKRILALVEGNSRLTRAPDSRRYSRRHQHQFGDQPLFDEGRRSSVGGSIHVERVSSSIEEVLPQWKGSRDEVTPLAKVVEALSVVA